MNQDGVSAALDLILEEIAAVENQLAAEGAAAFRDKRYDRADKLSQSGKKLLSFREKLDNLTTEWNSGIDAETRRRVKIEPVHTKKAKTRLKVTLPSGRVIQERVAAETFVDVIEELGLEDVRELGLTVRGIPLVGTKQSPRYSQTPKGSYWILTHSSTSEKKEQLDQIGKSLGKTLKVEIVPAQGTS